MCKASKRRIRLLFPLRFLFSWFPVAEWSISIIGCGLLERLCLRWRLFHLLTDSVGRFLRTWDLLRLQVESFVNDPFFQPVPQHSFLSFYVPPIPGYDPPNTTLTFLCLPCPADMYLMGARPRQVALERRFVWRSPRKNLEIKIYFKQER